jgi:hypothetical protein
MKTEIFEISINSGLVNARMDMKIDIVNPIPARKPTPMMFFQFSTGGRMTSPD